MSLAATLEDSKKKGYYLVEFLWDDGAGPGSSAARYTNWNASNLTAVGGRTFYATPSMNVTPGTNVGTFDDNAWQFQFSRDPNGGPNGDFAYMISDGSAWPPISVTVYDVTVDAGTSGFVDIAGAGMVVFSGAIRRAVRNHQGRTGVVMLEALSYKSDLKIPLGIVANDQCAWTFGSAIGCKMLAIDPTIRQVGQQVATITFKQLQFTAPLVVGGPYGGGDGFYFRRGYVQRGGLVIGIRDWDPTKPDMVQLTREPPARWIGLGLVVMPGCDKSLNTCKNRWHNEVNFGGFGIGMPNYNPIIKKAPQ